MAGLKQFSQRAANQFDHPLHDIEVVQNRNE